MAAHRDRQTYTYSAAEESPYVWKRWPLSRLNSIHCNGRAGRLASRVATRLIYTDKGCMIGMHMEDG